MRALGPADQPDWRVLRLQALQRHPAAFLTTAAEQKARLPGRDRQMLAMGNWYGLFGAAGLIAQAALIPMAYEAARHRMEIGGFYVSDAAQGSGAARALMDALSRIAVARGARQLELMVAADNPRAIRFYERNGFARFGTLPRAVWVDGRGQDDFFYVRFLDGAAPPQSG